MTGFEYIRQFYRVPAKRLGRVRYWGGKEPREGTITGTSGPGLTIRLDGEKHARPYHPTWALEYLDPEASLRSDTIDLRDKLQAAEQELEVTQTEFNKRRRWLDDANKRVVELNEQRADALVRAEKAETQVASLIESLLDVVNQSCQVEYTVDQCIVHDCGTSAYEDACELLNDLGYAKPVDQSRHRWELTWPKKV